MKKLEGKPFVLLGINSDRTRDIARKAAEKEQLTWRSWWDQGTKKGPIASRWNVHAWPTIYVIDGKGVIRFKDVQHEELDKALDALVKEVERG